MNAIQEPSEPMGENLKGISRGPKALQSNTNSSYHKGVLYWPEPTINRWTSRVMVSIMDGLGGPSPSVTIGIQQPSHNMLRGQWGYQIQQELATQTPGYSLNYFSHFTPSCQLVVWLESQSYVKYNSECYILIQNQIDEHFMILH